jgi:hypothetical protein
MKNRTFIIVLLILLNAGICFSAGSLANENNSGLYIRSIEQMLRLSPQEIDLATASLIVSEEWSDLVQGRRYLSDLEDMAYEIRTRLEEKNIDGTYKAIEEINNYLFDELGYTSVDKAHKT